MNVVFTHPSKEDGAAMWSLAEKSTLDTNSPYKYILMSEYFRDTCVVAKQHNQVVGFITAFISPKKPDTLFIWQVGVDSSQQGKGIATKMLHYLLEQSSLQKIQYVEATITPSNKASQSLFQKLARDYRTDITSGEFFTEDIFPGDGHEEELRFVVGPLHT
ncbi:diaminobutyrate acetyltransferase [Gracilibacillus halotolerans]